MVSRRRSRPYLPIGAPDIRSARRKKRGERSLTRHWWLGRAWRGPGAAPGGGRAAGKAARRSRIQVSLAGDPDESIDCPPAVCCGCGADLASAPVTARHRHQVTDIEPAPAPKVTEYVAQAKECAGCGAVSAGELPAHVRARASHGPETCAQAANLVSGHHIPIYRATLVLCQLAGIAGSTGWLAGSRGKAAALVAASGVTDRVRELLKTAPALHADE